MPDTAQEGHRSDRIDGGDAPRAAITRIRQIVGEQHVLATADAIERHSTCTIPWKRTCAAIVYPGSADEVSQIVKLAAEFRLGVWPFSRGHNWGYGTTMACHDGAIIVILERLNRILEVNEELAYAVIEPGVTQRQLNDHLKACGAKLWADCTDSTPDGSVLGNALERGVGYTAYGDHFGHLCGLEVVLPTGEVMRTGGGPPNSTTWNVYKWGTGPYLDGLFSQSNYGIVTKAGIWLMPEPKAFNCFLFEVADERYLPQIIDAIRRLALGHAVQSNVHMVNDFLFMSLLMQYPYELRQGAKCLSDETLAALRRQFRIPPWALTGGIYGTPAQVRANRAEIRRELSPFGKLTFLNDQDIARLRRMIGRIKRTRDIPVLGWLMSRLKSYFISPSPLEVLEVIPHVYPILKGIPGEHIVSCAYFKQRGERPRTDIDPARDRCGLIWFAPVVPMTSRHTTEVLDIGRRLFRQYGFEFSMSFILVNPRAVVMLMEIFYDRESAEEGDRARRLYDDLTAATVDHGYQQYRTSVAYMDRILARAPELRKFLDSLKLAVDPFSIVAPGRYGVGLPGSVGEGRPARVRKV